MIYYKLLNLNLTSRIALPPVQYKIGEWVVASEEADQQGYGLLVFNSFTPAERLRRLTDFDRIFKCEVRGVYPKLPTIGEWFYSKPWRHPDPDVRWPKGTVMVSAVKLLEEMK